jgi:hypothetical protein
MVDPNVVDVELYEAIKRYIKEKYKKRWNAYYSGLLVQTYKELGGRYKIPKPKQTDLARWFKEDWKDIGEEAYPVYRPTKRITQETPLTVKEIDPKNLKEQIKLKQKIKGKNLPKFKSLSN